MRIIFALLLFSILSSASIFGCVALANVTAASDWVAISSDSICGLSSTRGVRSPGVIDYQKVYDATDSGKKMKKDGVDLDSPKGAQLDASAKREIRVACITAMNAAQLDSLWKKITNKKGILPTDVTVKVIKEL